MLCSNSNWNKNDFPWSSFFKSQKKDLQGGYETAFVFLNWGMVSLQCVLVSTV